MKIENEKGKVKNMDIFKTNVGSFAMLLVATVLTVMVSSVKGCDSPVATLQDVEPAAAVVADAITEAEGAAQCEEPSEEIAEVLSPELRTTCRDLIIVDTSSN